MKKMTKKVFTNLVLVGAISGIIPASVTMAAELTATEMVATSEIVQFTANQGDTISFQIKLQANGNLDHNATVKVYTEYHIDGNTVTRGGEYIWEVDAAENGNRTKVINATITISPNANPSTYSSIGMIAGVVNDVPSDKQILKDNDLDTLSIKVNQPADTTPPTINLVNPLNGIYNANNLPNTFNFNLNEASEVFLNGVSKGSLAAGSHTLPLPTSVQGNNTVILTAKDAAGNTSTPVSFTYFYDTINPLVTATADRNANTNGWYNNDVKVTFGATDENGSGVKSVDSPVTVSTEGENQIITGSATDNAGNVGSGSIRLSIDKTAPTISGGADRVANSFGWYNKDVTVSFDALDSLSGVQSVTGPVTLGEGANQSVNGTATDKADNSSSTTVSGINIDKTAPTINGQVDSAPNSYGWYNKDVTVSFVAHDALSGVRGESVTAPRTLVEGANQSVNGTATDKADNSNSTTVTGISIDKTAPVIEGLEDGAKFTLNQVVNWSASDNLSGLITEKSGTVDTSKVGTYSITATDKAGNTIVRTYSVVYNFGGILQPINSNGTSVFKAGSTIPVKFQLTDSQGAYISTANATIHYAKYSDNVLGTETEAVSTSAATTGNLFRYDFTSNQYIFNLSTKGLTTGSYLITIKLGDGTSQTVKISLK